MLATIFSVIAIIVSVLIMWGLACLCLGVCCAAIKVVLESPIFWFAVLGGLIAYACGYRSDRALINGMICGGGIVVLFAACSLIESYAVVKVICWAAAGLLIGYFAGMMVFCGIIGLLVGIYRVC